MFIYYVLILIILSYLQNHWQNKVQVQVQYKRILHIISPSLDPIIIFNVAIGEEFIFRILPHLICDSCFMIRLLISSFIFGILHAIPLIKGIKILDEIQRTEIFITIIYATKMGMILSLIESLFTSPIYWYITCCLIHGLGNMHYIYNNNKNIIYNSEPKNLGFVSYINSFIYIN